MHEIITLQFGQSSNYLATHFWNIQESYFTYSDNQESIVNHDIHFRPGLGVDGSETFTPRALIYDLKGGFGSLRKLNALYEIDEPAGASALWDGPTVVEKQTAIQQIPYQQSIEQGVVPAQLTADSVRYWSDFNRIFYHPRSIVQLNDYEVNSAIMPFDTWETGEGLFRSLDREHDLLDRDMRPFVEESDQMQGIQIISGTDDAWGGFAARYVERIKDEYGKTPIVFWGNEAPTDGIPRDKKLLKLSNSARSLAEISQQASLYVPMSTPTKALPSYVAYDRKSQWHTSSLLATALESMSLSSRLKTRSGSQYDELASFLNVNGNQNIAKLRMSINQSTNAGTNGSGESVVRGKDNAAVDSRVPNGGNDDTVSDDTEDTPRTFDLEFFPSNVIDSTPRRRNTKRAHVFGQVESYRGSKLSSATRMDENEGLRRARLRAASRPIVQELHIPLSFPLLDSFPTIYDTHVCGTGELSVDTSLSTDTTVTLSVKALQTIVQRTAAIEEREALSNTLGEIAESYQEGYDSGSDDDDD